MRVIPEDRPGEFNQALMELGEVVCIPNGMPACSRCPLAPSCRALAEGIQTELPVKPAKKERRIEKRTLLVLECGGFIAAVKRPPAGLLADLWEFPAVDGYLTMEQVRELIGEHGGRGAQIRRLRNGKHIFSHVEWHMRGYHVVLERRLPQDLVPGLAWIEREEFEKNYAVPVAFHSFLRQL